MTAVEQRTARRRRPVAVTLNTRVSLDIRRMIEDVAEREDLSIREVVETALLEKWGSGTATTPERTLPRAVGE